MNQLGTGSIELLKALIDWEEREKGGDTGVDLLSLELAQAVCQQLSYLEEPPKGKRKSGGEGDKRERGEGVKTVATKSMANKDENIGK